MNWGIIISHYALPERNEMAIFTISIIKQLLPNAKLLLYSISSENNEIVKVSENVFALVDYYEALPKNGHYLGEITIWARGIQKAKELECEAIIKTCSDCKWKNIIVPNLTNPINKNTHDVVTSSFWHGGGTKSQVFANTQVFSGKTDILEKVLPTEVFPSTLLEKIFFDKMKENKTKINFIDLRSMYSHSHNLEELKKL